MTQIQCIGRRPQMLEYPIDGALFLDACNHLELAAAPPAALNAGDTAKRAESIAKTRFKRWAQVIDWWRWTSVCSAGTDAP